MVPFAVVILLMVTGRSNPLPAKNTNSVLSPTRANNGNHKTRSGELIEIIEEVTNRHIESLERLLEYIQRNENLLTKLFEILTNKRRKNKNYHTRRSDNDEVKPENPIIEMGKSIHKYGNLFINVIAKELNADVEPTVEIDTDSEEAKDAV